MGVAPTERLKLRRRVAPKITTSLSLFMEAFGLEVEEDLSAMATQTWAERVWIGTWPDEQREAWMNQALEVQTRRQVRWPAGAVMCETRDLGIKWPHRQSLIFEGEVRIDMRCSCNGPGQFIGRRGQQGTRKKKEEEWTKNIEMLRGNYFLEGGWVQKRLFDIGWSDQSKCQACHKEEGTEKHVYEDAQGDAQGRSTCQKIFGQWRKRHLGGHDFVRS